MSAVNNEFTHKDGVSLKDYIDGQFMAQCKKCELCHKAVEDRFDELQRATDLARSDMNYRLAGMNEFRESLRDAQLQFMSREEYKVGHDALVEKIDNLRLSEAALAGKASQRMVMVSIGFSLIAACGTLAGIIIAIVLH
jgi:hypothetical protein